MKKRNILFLIPFLVLGSACGEQPNSSSENFVDDYGPDEEGGTLVPPTDVYSKYEKGNQNHESESKRETATLRIHYRRNDDSKNNRQVYDPWNIWAWDAGNGGNGDKYDFTHYDDYGVYVDIDLSVIGEGKDVSKVGFLVRTDNWAKDPDNDRFVTIEETSNGGIQDIYVKSADSTIFDSPNNALKSTISSAILKDLQNVNVYFKPLSKGFRTYSKRFIIKVNGNVFDDYSVGDYVESTKSVSLKFNSRIDLSDEITIGYKFDAEWINEVPLMATSYFDTDEFKDSYTYTGDDLGVTFDDVDNPTLTKFKVWAPTSKSVTLKVYNTGDYETDLTPLYTYSMTKGNNGVFQYTVNEDLDGKYYTYEVTNSKGVNEVVDPYAKSAGVNGKRGMVVNFTKLNSQISGWNSDERPDFGSSNVDASIYEMHIRDMTINPNSGVSEEKRGKFVGLTEKNTSYNDGQGHTVSTGLSHIKELGISHVQIQPMYDYSSVDESISSNEMSTTNYNWGYDPLNYNVIEGSYSTNPNDGYQRIKEFKQMVMAMHNEGININLDVVYNHTSSSDNSNFNLLVPYYYYRTYSSGTFYNGSGCGNEMASNRYMVNKFIRESCEFWVNEYHISGFRFDLMGLIDNQTMIDVYKDCSEIYSKIMIYGEPWTGGTSKLKDGINKDNLSNQKTVQSSLAQSYFSGSNILVGAFNDVIRNAVRGGNNIGGDGRGFVHGVNINASSILPGIIGTFSTSDKTSASINPNQVLNYVSCHDNYTLNDQLVGNNTTSDNAYTQADSIIFLAQGIPFIQEGEEFRRSKLKGDGTFDGNSYNTGDFINNMDYSLKIENSNVYSKIKELINFRKNNSEFRLSSRDEITRRVTNVKGNNGLVCYQIDDLLVLHTSKAQNVTLDGKYEVCYTNIETTQTNYDSMISLQTNQSIVLRKVSD